MGVLNEYLTTVNTCIDKINVRLSALGVKETSDIAVYNGRDRETVQSLLLMRERLEETRRRLTTK